MHGLAFLPNGADDDDVAGADQDGGNEEKGHGDEGEVDLPLPGFFQVDPALHPVEGDLLGVVKEQDGRGEEGAEDPGRGHQSSGSAPAPAKVHGMGDGVVAVDAEGHQDIVGGVGDDALEKADDLAGDWPRVP